MTHDKPRVIPFEQLRMADVDEVGGKNASLGEMISQLAGAGIRVPGGFATTASAFREFLAHEGLAQRIGERLARLDVGDVAELARAGAQIRGWIADAPLPAALRTEIRAAYDKLTAGSPESTFAVRSSATAEDLPDASFAGQQETFLNINGIDNIFHAIREVFASLYNDRAIAYRVHQGYADVDVALSAGVQRMVRSDEGSAGVMFTLDTESGFDQVVFITSSYGLGELVVQGAVNPDEFYVDKRNLEAGRPAILRKTVGGKALKMVFGAEQAAGKSTSTVEVPAADRVRFSITDAEVEELARYAVAIERHYGRPMDIEWGRDGAGRQALHPSGAAGNGEVAGRGRRSPAALPAGRHVRGAGHRPGDRPEDRPGLRAPRQRCAAEMDARRGRRRAGHRHDRPRLGAGDEARRGDRHQSRRPHLPCGDHRARARRPGGGRLRRCHDVAARRR